MIATFPLHNHLFYELDQDSVAVCVISTLDQEILLYFVDSVDTTFPNVLQYKPHHNNGTHNT